MIAEIYRFPQEKYEMWNDIAGVSSQRLES